jgi:hypothetical protein
VLRADPGQEPFEAFGKPDVEHRPVEHVSERVAHRGRRRRLGEAGDELVVHRLVADHRAERGAPLPGGAEPAEQRPLDREVDVGAGGHDHRILPA